MPQTTAPGELLSRTPRHGRISAIYRYPLKSAGGERLASAEVTEHGITGDRTWACVDRDGSIGSLKQPRRWQRLVEVTASLAQPPHDVVINVPGHPAALAGTEQADDALSDWLGRQVRLSRVLPPNAVIHRWWSDEPGMIPEWVEYGPGQETAQPADEMPGGRFYDQSLLHVVTTAALDMLGQHHGASVAAIRFRPNLLIDLPVDLEPGLRLRIGDDLVIEITIPTARCVLPAAAHGDVPADYTLLSTLARHYRIEVPLRGKAACFGWYADVRQPGTIQVGDVVAVA